MVSLHCKWGRKRMCFFQKGSMQTEKPQASPTSQPGLPIQSDDVQKSSELGNRAHDLDVC